MKQQLMTFDEAKEDILDAGHKSVSLFTKNGDKVVPFNNSKIKVEERLDEIEKRLKSKVTEDDIYQLKAKHYGTRSTPAVYYIASQDYIDNLGSQPPALSEDNKTNEVEKIERVTSSTYPAHEYHALFQKKTQLEYDLKDKDREIKQLKEEVENLKDEIEEMEQETEKSSGLLSDNNKEFLGGVVEQVTPLLDKMLQQRDVSQQMEFLRLQMQMGQVPKKGMNDKPPMHPPHNGQMNEQSEQEQNEDFVTEQEERHLDGMALLQQQNPELYEKTMQQLEQYYKEEGGENE